MFNVLLAGPCKWLPFEKSITSIICGMILHGCGLGASLVGGFSDAHKSAVSFVSLSQGSINSKN